MAIPVRGGTAAPIASNPNPTRGQVEVASKKLATLTKLDEDFARDLFDRCIRNTDTSKAVIRYAIFALRCVCAEKKLAGPDLASAARARGEKFSLGMYNSSIDGELEAFKAQLYAIGKEDDAIGPTRQLFVGPARKVKLTKVQERVVVGRLLPMFAPPEGTPLEKNIHDEIVGGWKGENLALADWLIRYFCEEEEYEAELASAKAAARATAQATAEVAEEEAEGDEAAA